MTSRSGPSEQEEEAQITFARAKNGRKRSIPIWFTVNEGKIELLPMYGSKTKWFMDVEKSRKMSLQVKDWKKDVSPTTVRDPRVIESIKGRFSMKYGDRQVRKYYPTQDVALEIPL